LPRIGVYVCHCGLNIAGAVNIKEVVEDAKKLPNVVVVKDYVYTCSDPGQEMIKEDIKQHKLDRIVIAACSPKMHEETFRKTLEQAGLNPYLLDIVNLREQCSWCHGESSEKATEKAKTLVRMGVARAAYLEPLEKGKIKAKKSVLIVGGGIAGIQAALDLADADFKVYLVEKTPSIGGKMAQLDKTFPTLDCSACILTPKMADAGNHPNIELLTCAEVESLNGYVGNYEVTVLKKPRYVDEEKCVGCGECEKVCPVTVPNEFDVGLKARKAIYRPFPQAIPNTYIIDKEQCIQCMQCEAACTRGAIDQQQEEEHVKLEIGAIILAVGCDLFNATLAPELGYGHYGNVVTNMEFERISNAAGPTEGKIKSPATGKTPKSVAFIQCVGSRDARFNEHCCRVGCMVTLKQAILVKEKLGKNVDVYVCFNDMRAFGKGFEEFYQRAREMGIEFINGLPSEVRMAQDDLLYFDVYDSGVNKLLQVQADLIVLVTGLVQSPDYDKFQAIFRVPRSRDGFFLETHPKLKPLDTPMAGIFLAGTCQGPKDIPDTVAQASGAAMKVADLLAKGEINIEPLMGVVDIDMCSGCGVCESICSFNAIQMKTENVGGKEKRYADIIKAICQGCGACAAACPVNAIKMKHFTDDQIRAQVNAACR
jgi:heterodisulfide reductase subunit A